jgi:hypothetical protein
MDAQEFRSLQEAYMEVVENQQLNEGYRELPADRMRGQIIKQAASGTKRAFLSRFRGQKGTTAGNVEDAKATRSLNRAKKMQDEIERREKLGSDFYRGPREGRARANKRMGGMKEGYDIILSHLLDEGYAETPEAAEAIMVNMSEEWRQSILG